MLAFSRFHRVQSAKEGFGCRSGARLDEETIVRAADTGGAHDSLLKSAHVGRQQVQASGLPPGRSRVAMDVPVEADGV